METAKVSTNYQIEAIGDHGYIVNYFIKSHISWIFNSSVLYIIMTYL